MRVALIVTLLSAPIAAGDLEFVDSGQRIGIHPNTVVELGDFDGDGDLDAVTPAYVSPITTWFNRGDGFFDLGEELGGSLSGNVQIADFDLDGDNDFFIINHSFQTTLYLNDGAGQFIDSELNLGSACQHSADQGDLDGDGAVDVVVGCIGGWWNRPFLNDGEGNLTPHGNNIVPTPRGLALGDFDGDGDLDAFAVLGDSRSSDENMVLLNDGSGVFTDSGQRLGERHSNAVGIEDFDGDGDLDAFVANNSFFGSDPANILWLNDGQGNFTDSGQRIGADDSGDIDVADFDLDGDPDVLIINASGPAQIWLNDGAGEFTRGPDLNPGRANIGRADVGDLDDDGDPDIYIIWPGGDRVFFNMTLQEAEISEVSIEVGTILAGDADSIGASDDTYLHTRSGFGQTLIDLHHMDMQISAVTTVDGPSSLDLTTESRIDEPAGTAQIRLLNHNTQQFDLVGQHALGEMDDTVTIPDIDATNYVNAQGEIELRIKHIVFVPFLAFTFESLIDWVEITVE